MNWKRQLQLHDIDRDQRLEATCKRCGHTHYVDVAALFRRRELQFIYIDELERMIVCKARPCDGPVRLALVHDRETEGFTGGLA